MSRILTVLGLALALGLTPAAPARSGGADTLEIAVGGRVQAVLDRGRLAAMAQHRLATDTPWTDRTRSFSGVLLRDLLAQAGIGRAAGPIRATALNGYAVTIPAADAWRHDVLVATRMDGEAMPVRRFGPFWIIYPLSAKPALDRAAIHARMIWQLSRLTAEGRRG